MEHAREGLPFASKGKFLRVAPESFAVRKTPGREDYSVKLGILQRGKNLLVIETKLILVRYAEINFGVRHAASLQSISTG
jgi:hypothetical protein